MHHVQECSNVQPAAARWLNKHFFLFLKELLHTYHLLIMTSQQPGTTRGKSSRHVSPPLLTTQVTHAAISDEGSRARRPKTQYPHFKGGKVKDGNYKHHKPQQEAPGM